MPVEALNALAAVLAELDRTMTSAVLALMTPGARIINYNAALERCWTNLSLCAAAPRVRFSLVRSHPSIFARVLAVASALSCLFAPLHTRNKRSSAPRLRAFARLQQDADD